MTKPLTTEQERELKSDHLPVVLHGMRRDIEAHNLTVDSAGRRYYFMLQPDGEGERVRVWITITMETVKQGEGFIATQS